MSIERDRLKSKQHDWRRWGPYVSDRAWGTVREDYSAEGDAWNSFPHDHARSRVYRWSEDGLAGICNDQQDLCFALALWNGRDPILKERLFGLNGPEGNHGEDVKECYFYLDNTPTHSYMKMLYKYPQAEFPYRHLVEENHRRSKEDPEFELIDTGIFDDNHYFDVFVEYAKAGVDDILIKITVANRGSYAAPIWLLPTLWFRNTWSWGRDDRKPTIHATQITNEKGEVTPVMSAMHPALGEYQLFCDAADELVFTNNETNTSRLYDTPNFTPYVKDAFHQYLISNDKSAVNPRHEGTKAAAVYAREVPAGGEIVIRLRLIQGHITPELTGPERLQTPFNTFDDHVVQRQHEADAFYAELQTWPAASLNSTGPVPDFQDLKRIQRQALAGMLWSKQYYYYDVPMWLEGRSGATGTP